MTYRSWIGRACFAGTAVLLFGTGSGAAAAQGVAAPGQFTAPAATGSVSGRVICQDTQRPARFAEVTLIPVEEAGSGEDDDDRLGRRGRRGSARTDLDGNYTVTNLSPGAYYATATATGYVSTMAALVARAGSTADTASLLAGLPQVQISGSGTGTANLSLERGGVIAGKVLWDDGSPATGVGVAGVLSAAQAGGNGRRQFNGLGAFGGGLGGGLGGGGGFTQTDDRGSFRLTGLAPGEYVVRASFAAPAPAGAAPGGPGGFGAGPGRAVNITLYAPGKVRRADAQVVTLALGEERGDVVFTADLRSLHSVAGRVSSAGEPAVHSGTVRLVDTVDATLSRNVFLNADGSFTVPYVPAGSFTLQVNASSATQGSFGGARRGGGNGAGGTPATTFQPLQQTLTVTDTDVSGLNLTVVPATAAASR